MNKKRVNKKKNWLVSINVLIILFILSATFLLNKNSMIYQSHSMVNKQYLGLIQNESDIEMVKKGLFQTEVVRADAYELITKYNIFASILFVLISLLLILNITYICNINKKKKYFYPLHFSKN